MFDIPGYDFVNRIRQTGFGGGVAAYIKHGFNWKRRLDLESEFLECLCIEISPKNAKSFVIIIMYRPPDTSKHLHKDFNQLFAQLLQKSSNTETIVMGDMNVNFLDINNNKEIESLFKLNGFSQLIKEATRIDDDTRSLDIIATNNASTIRKTGVIPTCLSDHEMIGFVRKVNNIK